MRYMKIPFALMITSAFLAGQIDPPGRVGRLNYMDGPVSLQPAGLNDWVDADINRPLTTGDGIWVGNRGRAELHVGSAALRFDANSDVQFLNLDDQAVQLRLSEGTMTVRLRNLGQNQIFEIDTPNLAFNLVRPGEYRIDANPDTQTTTVTVRDGEGDVSGGGESLPVYARQQLLVRGDDQITYNLVPVGPADPWDQWCSTRDRREDQSQSARYVSREVAGYDDLDQYGRWDNQPGYGSVWMPTSVAVGWAPYRDGHWAWISPWGWTWVDDEPWGFAPYHYGRWASFNGRWGWIPGPSGVTPIYAPALVGWVGGGSGFSLSFSIGTAAAVGWFPLGPREPYFPSYQVSQGYFTRLNTTNTVISTTIVNNYYTSSRNPNNQAIASITYANRNVQNGVTAVPRDSFARGRRITQEARSVPAAQLGSVQVVAAPAIAPQRESVLGPQAGTAARAARPPANAISRAVVARTPPPPPPVPFERQQPALAQNPGRPLPPAAVQGARQNAQPSSPQVRVIDSARLRRVQPTVGAGPQAGQPQNSIDQPGGPGRGNGRQQNGRQQPQTQVPQPQAQPQAVQPQVNDRQKGRQQQPQAAQPQAAQPEPVQPQGNDRQKGPPGRQFPQPQATPPQPVQPAPVQPPPVVQPPVDQQKGRGRQQPQAVQPQAQPDVNDRQKGRPDRQQQPPPQVSQPQGVTPQPPPNERRNGPPGRQQPQQTPAPPPQAVQPQAVQPPPPQPPPPVNQRQNGPPPRQQAPPEPPRPPVAAPPPPAPAAPPAAQPAPPPPQQNKGNGKQDKSQRDEKGKNKE
jgi:hypothetical protein